MATPPTPEPALSMQSSPLQTYPGRESTHTPIPRSHLPHGSATSSAVADEPDLPRHRAMMAGADTEDQPSPPYTHENDPFHLSARIKTQSEINLISANTGRKRDRFNPLNLARHAGPNLKLQGFYQAQNSTIERLLRPVDEHVRQARDLSTAHQLRYQIAVYGSFGANIVLAILQLFAAISSGSLSLFTTMADAIFDPASNLTLLLCHQAVSKVDARRFPAGKARIETAGNIIFCFLMTSVSSILITFSLRSLIVGATTPTTTFHLAPTIAVSLAFVTKLALFLYCHALRHQYSQIRLLWADHRNDLLINGLGLLSSIAGAKLHWWLDPAGALLLSLLIATLWLRTAHREFHLLIGLTADTATQQLLTYISVTHSARIIAIDTVRAWHSGPRLVVEVDVVMDPDESLRATHDIAEELQFKLESLPDVERAYVHVDYETTHKPEHFLKKEL